MHLHIDETLHLKTQTFAQARVIYIPDAPKTALKPQHFIAEGMLNPRGICEMDHGSLLVAEAGSGHANAPFSGRVSRMRPHPTVPGKYLSPEIVVGGFRSINMQGRMLRDEIMGVADIVSGGGYCLLSQTDYIDGSKLLSMQSTPPTPVFHSKGNLNSLCWHPKRSSWFAVKPDQNLLVEFSHKKNEQVITELAKFSDGQDAVPVAVIYEEATGALLISLFSGERHRHAHLKGMDFAEKAGQIIRVWPDTGACETLVTALQFPTGLAFKSEQELLVLELCDRLLEPLTEDWQGDARHGGYARFSGRLLNIDLLTGEVRILAEHLDTPSNLCVLKNNAAVLISEGMGLTGRLVPTRTNEAEKLTGRVRWVELN